ncbi:MAG TPA: phosphatidylserine decarboxylase [Bacteroidia bacterium]|nr:phosphatidylserine decarboxylase [Bacteroidia bacterium]
MFLHFGIKKTSTLVSFCFLLTILLVAGCQSEASLKKASYGEKTKELIDIVENDTNLKSLLVEAINQAKKINPNRNSNPAQTLEEYYDFIAYAEKAMPWGLLPQMEYSELYTKLDQGLCYYYFINDQPLPELNGKGFYNNSLQYVKPYSNWLINFNKGWGSFLDKEASWSDAYYQMALKDNKFGLKNDWYEDASHWKTFNQFFSRHLKSADKRPIADVNDNSIVDAPADSQPQGVWQIDSNSNIMQKEGVAIKSGTLNSIEKLIGEGSKYKKEFANGVFTHTYLDINDYHRYHFPVSGTVKEVSIIEGENAAGCILTWDSINKRYVYDASVPGWQSIETRGCVIVETEEFGLVALLPIGMSQVCSVNFENNIKVGTKVKKGDMMGYFLFGGSDFMMVFQQKAGFVMDVAKDDKNSYHKLLMGEHYGKLEIKNKAR